MTQIIITILVQILLPKHENIYIIEKIIIENNQISDIFF